VAQSSSLGQEPHRGQELPGGSGGWWHRQPEGRGARVSGEKRRVDRGDPLACSPRRETTASGLAADSHGGQPDPLGAAAPGGLPCDGKVLGGRGSSSRSSWRPRIPPIGSTPVYRGGNLDLQRRRLRRCRAAALGSALQQRWRAAAGAALGYRKAGRAQL
jgi:hypothetical protein